MASEKNDAQPLTFVPLQGLTTPSFEGATLVIASVTIGNVPQLAVDLLLASSSSAPVGRLRAPALLPFAGISEDGKRVLTAAELYISDRVVILQHHAPPACGRASEHATGVMAWACSARFAEVLILCSANAAGRRDAQLRGAVRGMARVVRGSHAPTSAMCAQRALDGGALPLEGVDADGVWRDDEAYPDGDAGGIAFLPLARPASFVRAALDGAAHNGLPATLLLAFAHEGENSADAAALAARAAHAAKLPLRDGAEGETAPPDVLMRRFTAPKSWTAMAPPPRGLY